MSGYSFGNGNATKPASGGFSFSTPATGTSSGFSFNTNVANTAAQPSGFAFGSTTQSSSTSGSLFGGSTGFSFNSTPATTASSGLSFGGLAKPDIAQTATSTAATGLSFGTQSRGFPLGGSAPSTQSATAAPNAQISAQQSTGFGLPSAQSTTQTSAGVFGGAPQQGALFGGSSSTAKPFSFGTPTHPTTQSGLTLGGTTSMSSTLTSALGAATPTTKPPGFGLGTSLATTTSGQQLGMGMGLTATSKPGFFGSTTAQASPFGSTVAQTAAQPSVPATGLSTFQTAAAPTIAMPLGKTPSGITSFGLPAPQSTASSGLTLGAPASTTKTGLGGFQLNTTKAPTMPGTGFQLGTSATSASTATPATQSGFLLSGSAMKRGGLSLTATSSAAPLSFGATTSLATSAAPVPSGGVGFSLNKSTSGLSFSTTAASSATSVTAPSTATTSAGLKLGPATGLKLSLPSSTTGADTTKPSTLSFGGGLKMPSATSVQTAGSSTASAASTATTQPPSLRYKDLETKINKWTSELEQQEHLFLTQATQVNGWNKLLIDNSEKITELNSEFERVKCDQERLDQELDFIKTQQEELEDMLRPLEEITRQQVASLSTSVHTHHADLERERTYNLAENVDGQLKRMVQDLREVIDHVNSSSSPADSTNPINQISKILSAHMNSLQWLDTNSVTLQHKLDQLTKQVTDRKTEQESRFRLAFD